MGAPSMSPRNESSTISSTHRSCEALALDAFGISDLQFPARRCSTNYREDHKTLLRAASIGPVLAVDVTEVREWTG